MYVNIIQTAFKPELLQNSLSKVSTFILDLHRGITELQPWKLEGERILLGFRARSQVAVRSLPSACWLSISLMSLGLPAEGI